LYKIFLRPKIGRKNKFIIFSVQLRLKLPVRSKWAKGRIVRNIAARWNVGAAVQITNATKICVAPTKPIKTKFCFLYKINYAQNHGSRLYFSENYKN